MGKVTLTLLPVCECGYVIEEFRIFSTPFGKHCNPKYCPGCNREISRLNYPVDNGDEIICKRLED